MDREQVIELLYQALETEIGGQQVYEAAITCAVNTDLREEWEKYLAETREHEQIMLGVLEAFGLDPATETPGRMILRETAASLVRNMESARAASPVAGQLVAAESVVTAEVKDHQNWELIGRVVDQLQGAERTALREAWSKVEEQEDMHLYHTMGWTRELWIESLGLPAVLPPPEEEKKVTTAIGAARAEQQRKEML
jgi:hypothetical protein